MDYSIIEGSEKMDLAEIMRLLKMTYWADKRSMEQVSKSVANSSCYGVYLDDEKKLIGFARVISDYATTYYLCDVKGRKGDKTMKIPLEEYIPYIDGVWNKDDESAWLSEIQIPVRRKAGASQK